MLTGLQLLSSVRSFFLNTGTGWKLSKYGVFSGPYFPVLGLNTLISKPEKTLYIDTFHIVWYNVSLNVMNKYVQCFIKHTCSWRVTNLLYYEHWTDKRKCFVFFLRILNSGVMFYDFIKCGNLLNFNESFSRANIRCNVILNNFSKDIRYCEVRTVQVL